MSQSAVVDLSPATSRPGLAGTYQQGKSRTIWRAWKQLSRFQRSLVYMLAGIALLLGAMYYMSMERQPLTAGVPSLAAKLQQSERQTQEYNVHNQALEPPEKRRGDIDWQQEEDKQNAKARNKVEAVHEVLEAPRDPIVHVNDDEDKNGAHEDDDEEEEEDEEDEYVDDMKRREGGDASNQAGEVADSHHLPPQDKSLTFRGPQNERQEAVVAAIKHAWDGYKSHAWGHDHLRPLSKSAQNWFGLGLTIVDSLDTLFIAGLKDEFEEAKEWVQESLDFSNKDKDVNLFETTIRVLGGLLSAHHLSGERVFLDKAKDLGDRLMGAFSSPSGVPYSDVNLRSTRGHAPKWSPDSSTSEVSTIQLEFRDLSRATGDPGYEEAVERVSRIIHDQPKSDGLVPIFINANTGKLRKQATITLGARGDSYYEYLLKQWLQTGKTRDDLRQDFVESIQGVEKRLARRTKPNNLLYLGEILSGGKDFKHKMDELTCFLPGTVALGVHHDCGLPRVESMRFAEELAYTCYLTFARQPTHLAAEITYYNSQPNSADDFYVKPNDAHYLLRPETVESFWYLYYITGNRTYQDWGWEVFQGIEKYTKVKSGGYTTIGNVRNALDVRPRDMMESFLLGETFKYLYLLFADRHEIPLDRWVLNTEAHLLPNYPN